MELEQFFRKFEEGLWSDPRINSLEWDCVQSNLHHISSYTNIDVLTYLFNNMNHEFNIPFLLCAPILWKDLRLTDWKDVILKINRPLKHKYLIDDPHCFDDVFFMFKFLRVDSLKLVFDIAEISEEKKRIMFNFFRLKINHLVLNEFDVENMEDGTWASEKYFEKSRDNLFSDGLSPVPKEINDIEKKIQNLLQEL